MSNELLSVIVCADCAHPITHRTSNGTRTDTNEPCGHRAEAFILPYLSRSECVTRAASVLMEAVTRGTPREHFHPLIEALAVEASRP